VPTATRHVFVRGRVQGVAFRWYARERAQELGLAGWVRNRRDGRVEAWLQGEAAAVEAMLVWLRRGPPAARVEGLEVRGVPAAAAAADGAFEIRPSS